MERFNETECVKDFVEEIDQYINMENYCYLIEAKYNGYTSGLYSVDESGVEYLNKTVEVFRRFKRGIEELLTGCGVLTIRKDVGKKLEYKIIPKYNPELFISDLFELIIYQEYGLTPSKDKRKVVLEKSIKKEKVKKTLAYACYLDDRVEIKKRLKKSQLDKTLITIGTPLWICAANDNLEGFKAIAEAGAKIGKSSIGETALKCAFRDSKDIVKYIYDNYREQFDKEVKKLGFSIATQSKDLELLQLLLENGCDVEGDGYPYMHCFVDVGNIVGIKFLLDQGVDINIKSKYNQTALQRLKGRGLVEFKEVEDFLIKNGAVESD